ncbi:hypothetical protein SynPROSU1_00961 [Synechococcus sp. PROS-U-1]|nr:hypothetical protein SynPROSU1_00961 [Synechococcus sp. PROS-U-1]
MGNSLNPATSPEDSIDVVGGSGSGACSRNETTQDHFFLNFFSAVRSSCHPDQRRHSISAAVRH